MFSQLVVSGNKRPLAADSDLVAAKVSNNQTPQSLATAAVFTDTHRQELAERGYTVVRNVFDQERCQTLQQEMWDFVETLEPRVRCGEPETYNKWPESIHRILQHHGVGQARFSWTVRCDSKVMQIFSELHQVGTDELLCSFDGACLMPRLAHTTRVGREADTISLKSHWTHSDQSGLVDGFVCAQGLLNLEDTNYEGAGGFLIYPMSHLIHKRLCEHYKLLGKDNWVRYTTEQLTRVQQDVREFLPNGHALRNSVDPVPLVPLRVRLSPGDFLLWDSRALHQSVAQMDRAPRDRAVIYVCMMPRSRATEAALKKKQFAFEQHRTTSHWADRATLFPKEPRTYGREKRTYGSIKHLTVNTKAELGPIGRRLAGYDE